MTPLDFFQALTTNLTSPEVSIERFSVSSICCTFDPEIGRLFQAWKDLKFLQLGDMHDEGHFIEDHRLDFETYNPVSELVLEKR